jgi:hypothetical protein
MNRFMITLSSFRNAVCIPEGDVCVARVQFPAGMGHRKVVTPGMTLLDISAQFQ